MRRIFPIILVLLIMIISINFIDNIMDDQINSLNADLSSVLGINIMPVRRGSALESNIRAWNMFIQNIRDRSSIDINSEFDLNSFAIFFFSHQNIIINSLLAIVIVVLLLPLRRVA